ncbi:hypothetical protein B0H14DRAFT_3469005 [Mycena olivaceomarginata]|nr:hypothetical protein B0H14DRAFT_3469005 [Mycena olivaceomarginata]
MGKKRDANKENETGTKDKKRARWNKLCDSILIAQLIAQKAAGNQTDNAGWHSSAWTACAADLEGSEQQSGGVVKTSDACQTRWTTLKSQYQLGFPLYDEMAQLVDGAVATGAGAFNPGQIVVRAPSPDWPEQLPDNDANEFPLDPVLKGPAGRVDPPSGAPQTPKLSSLDISMDTSRSGDNSDDDIESSFVSRRRVRAMSDPPSSTSKRRRTDGHGRKLSNGHALMAVSQSLEGIAAALKAESTGPSSPQRKTAVIKIIMKMTEFTKEEKSQILRLIRADTGIADTFLAIKEEDAEYRVDYLRTELQP